MADNQVQVTMEFTWDDPANTALRASVNGLLNSEEFFKSNSRWVIVDGTMSLVLNVPEAKLAELIKSLGNKEIEEWTKQG